MNPLTPKSNKVDVLRGTVATGGTNMQLRFGENFTCARNLTFGIHFRKTYLFLSAKQRGFRFSETAWLLARRPPYPTKHTLLWTWTTLQLNSLYKAGVRHLLPPSAPNLGCQALLVPALVLSTSPSWVLNLQPPQQQCRQTIRPCQW